MPTEAQLHSALRNAHAAGDTEAARKLANAIKQGQFGDTPVSDQAESASTQGASGAIDPRKVTAKSFLAQMANTVNRSIPELLELPLDVYDMVARRVGGAEFGDPITSAYDRAFFGDGDPNYLPPGTARNVADAAGVAIPLAMGAVPVARSESFRSTMADLAGFGSTTARAAGQSIAPELGAALDAPRTPAALPVERNLPAVTQGQRARDLELSQAVTAGEGDSIAAGYRVNPTRTRIVESPAGREAIKQGVEPAVVSMLQSSPPLAKKRMVEMLDIARKTKENVRYGVRNRPSDIPGDSLMKRVKVIREVNRAAGQRIDKVAQTLKGQDVDVSPAVNNFLESIENMGIKYNPNNRSLDFSESDIRGLTGIESTVRRVIRQMEGKGPIDAYDVHRMKRILDEQVTYGKSAEGLGGRVERELKTLRRGLDGALDEAFPAYNRVNTQYAETIGALDALQDVAGTKMDLSGGNADKAVGTLMRRVLSNAQSRIRLLDAMDEVEGVAQKYLKSDSKELVSFEDAVRGTDLGNIDLDDDILAQVRFMTELEKLFGSSAPTSFLGELEKAETPMVRAALTGDTTEAKVGLARGALNKIRGINEESAINALESLLKE